MDLLLVLLFTLVFIGIVSILVVFKLDTVLSAKSKIINGKKEENSRPK